VGTAESGHRQPAAEFWTACDETLAAGGDLTRAYGQLAAARRRRAEQRVQAARYRRGGQPKVTPLAVAGLHPRHGLAGSVRHPLRRLVRSGAGSALETVSSVPAPAIGTAAGTQTGVAALTANRTSKLAGYWHHLQQRLDAPWARPLPTVTP